MNALTKIFFPVAFIAKAGFDFHVQKKMEKSINNLQDNARKMNNKLELESYDCLVLHNQMERMQSKVDELEKGRKESDKKYKSQEQKVSEALYCISILGLCITGLTLQDVAKSLRIW